MVVIDQNIINRLRNRDSQAFKEVWDISYALVYNTALRMVEDKAAVEDIIQECYLRIWENADYQNGDHLMGSLMQSVRYRCQSYLQSGAKQARFQGAIAEVTAVTEDPFDSVHDEAELMNYIDQHIHTLPAHLQTYYRLLKAGHKQHEISKIMDIQPETVYNFRFKLKNILRKLVHKHRWTTILMTLLAAS